MKIIRDLIAIMLASMLLMLSGCAEVPSSTGSAGSQTAATHATTRTTTTATTTARPAENISVQSYADEELKLNYSRPTESALRKGDSGESVKWLQAALNKAMSAGLSVDGDFGKGTESSVREFQNRCGLYADGVAGPQTIAALIEVAAGRKSLPAVTTKATTTTRTTTQTTRTTTERTTKTTTQNVFTTTKPRSNSGSYTYVCNIRTHIIHKPNCGSVSNMNEKNKWYADESLDTLLKNGYTKCKNCFHQ